MRPGHGNGTFIADAHNPRLTLAEIRTRYSAGDYGKMRPDYAKAWLAMANRKVTM